MEKKRSIGVTIVGYYLLLYGIIGFLGWVIWNTLFVRNSPICINLLTGFSRHFRELNNSEVSLSEISRNMIFLIKEMHRDHPSLMLIDFMIIPLLCFLLFWGSIGILRLKEQWRKRIIIVFPLIMLFRLIAGIYFKFYVLITIIIGKIADPKGKDIISETMNFTKFYPQLFVKDLIATIFWCLLIVFFLTRPNVKEQFSR